MIENKIIIGDSIIYRQGLKRLVYYPKMLFGNSIKIDSRPKRTINYINDNDNYLKLKEYEYIFIQIGIVDCYPRYKLKKGNKIDINKYSVDSEIETFENNIKKLVNVLVPNFNKLILISIVQPPKQYTMVRNHNYSEIIKKQVFLYNNIFKKYAETHKFVYYVDIDDKFQNKYNIDEYLADASGHVYPNKEIVFKYAKIIKEALLELQIPGLNFDNFEKIIKKKKENEKKI